MHDAPILVIDDDLAILEAVTDILTFEGYTVACATNGVEGLKLLEQFQPRLVLLDMRMPVLDGWGFVRMVRQQGRILPIVVMTAAQDAQHWAREIAADGYLAKPFELLELLDAVEQIGGEDPGVPG
jgi:CheY-like chemotaxis protein